MSFMGAPGACFMGPHSRIGGPAGLVPSLNLNFIDDYAWSPVGVTTATSLVTVTRASDGYAPNAAGVYTLFSSNVLRRTNLGALVEESRTNSIRNNSMQGASAPSTYPTNWSAFVGGDGALSVVGTGTENGIDYIDIRYTGTSAGVGSALILLESSTQIVAADTQTWTSSLFAKIAGGSTSGAAFANRINFRTAAGASVALQDVAFTPTSAGLGTQRVPSNVFTASGGTIARVTNSITFTSSSGSTDITLRIGWPQLELGAFATSPIRTTSAAATRAADNISLTSFAGAGVNAAAGTLYAEFVVPSAPTTSANPAILNIGDGTNANRDTLFLSQASGKAASGNTFAASANQGRIDGSTAFSAGATVKAAYAFAANDRAIVTNGGAAGTSSTGTRPTGFSLFEIGTGVSFSTTPLNGYLRRVAYFPTRLTNAQLQALTT